MAGRHKVLVILLVLCLTRFGRSQISASIGQNFCQNNLGIVDNLSCTNEPIEGQACFTRDNLCNGVALCPGMEDEGSDATLSSLQCKHPSDFRVWVYSQKCPNFSVLVSTDQVLLFTEVTSLQGVGIEGFHCILRCQYFE